MAFRDHLEKVGAPNTVARSQKLVPSKECEQRVAGRLCILTGKQESPVVPNFDGMVQRPSCVGQDRDDRILSVEPPKVQAKSAHQPNVHA